MLLLLFQCGLEDRPEFDQPWRGRSAARTRRNVHSWLMACCCEIQEKGLARKNTVHFVRLMFFGHGIGTGRPGPNARPSKSVFKTGLGTKCQLIHGSIDSHSGWLSYLYSII